MKNIKFEKRTLVIILITTIGLSLFAGLVSAARRADPLNEILELVTATWQKVVGIESNVDDANSKLDDVQCELDDIDVDLDNIQADLDEFPNTLGSSLSDLYFDLKDEIGNPTQILGYHDEIYESETHSSYVLFSSDKPALFTVTVNFLLGDHESDELEVWYSLDKDFNMLYLKTLHVGERETLTIAGYGLLFACSDQYELDCEVIYCVVVQGERDTVVTFGDWT